MKRIVWMKTMSNFLFLLIVFISGSIFGQEPAPGITAIENPGNITDEQFKFKTAMVSGLNGDIWIAFEKWDVDNAFPALARYHATDGWTVYNKSNSPLPSDTINALFIKDGDLFLGTNNGIAVYNYNDNSFSLFEGNNSLPIKTIRALAVSDDHLYAGTNSGLFIYSFQNHTWSHYLSSNSGLIYDIVNVLALTENDCIWIGTNQGLSFFNHHVWNNFTNQNTIMSNHSIHALYCDSKNRLWINTFYGKIYRVENNIFTDIRSEHLSFYRLPSSDYKVSLFTENQQGDIFFNDSRLVRYSNEGRYYLFTGASGSLICASGDSVFVSPMIGNLKNCNYKKMIAHTNYDFIDINNIRSIFSSDGAMRHYQWNVDTGFCFEAPRGSGKHTIFTNKLRVGAKDLQNNIHIAGSKYLYYELSDSRMNDFATGPISSSPEGYFESQEKMNHIWKLSKSQIEYHKANYSSPYYQMPWAIENWPAHGDSEYGQRSHLAPFKDLNFNTVYEPHLGEYPIIRGDKALVFIFNDSRFPGVTLNRLPLNIEVLGMVYGYDNPSDQALHNTIFLNYQIVNASGIAYDSLYFGHFNDFEIGYGYDDFIGCDTLLNMVYAYNGTATDGTSGVISYNEYPPAQGIVFLSHPLHAFRKIGFATDVPAMNENESAQQAFLSLQGRWNDNQPIFVGGNGYPGQPGVGETQTRYLFPGDVNDNEQWQEFTVPNEPGDRRGIGSAYHGHFEPDERICFEVAFVFAQFTGSSMNNNISSVNLLKEHAQDIRDYYLNNNLNDYSDIIPTSIIEQKPSARMIACYPNPFKDMLTLAFVPQSNKCSFFIYNVLGKTVYSGRINENNPVLNLNNLPVGTYIIKVIDGDEAYHGKIIKY